MTVDLSFDDLQPCGGNMDAKPLDAETDIGAVWVARDENGVLHLLVPVNPTSVIQPEKLSIGIILVGQELDFSGVQQKYVDVACAEPSLNHLFDLLCLDVVRRVLEGTDPIRAAHQSLADWRKLFRQARVPERMEVLGLRAEVEFVLELVRIHGPAAVSWWRGGGAVFDVTTTEYMIDVKATESTTGATVVMHGLDQIDNVAGDLHLSLHRLLSTPGGLNIGDFLEDLRSAGVTEAELDPILGAVDYDPELEEWTERFVTTSSVMWRVDDDFPGLRRSALPDASLAGVSDVNYRLDLEVRRPLNPEERTNLLQRLAVD